MVILIEAAGLVFRSFWSANKRDEPYDEQPALDEFAVRLGNVRRYGRQVSTALRCDARYMLVWDTPGNVRKERVTTYKAQRDKPPEELLRAYKACQIFGSFEGWESLSAPRDWEADDVIASVARQAAGRGVRCQIHSVDKDFNQCLRKGVVGICKRVSDTGKPQTYTEDDMRADFGFGPERWVDYQCLIGDSADNIKGLPGYGPKLSAALLRQHDGPLETMPVELLRPKQQKLWPDFLSQLDELRFLLTLQTDLELMKWDL